MASRRGTNARGATAPGAALESPPSTDRSPAYEPLFTLRPSPIDDSTEWLEPDGLGGFASGTATGINTRRYHALLLASSRPPTDRHVLVNSFDAWLEVSGPSPAVYPLSSNRYAPGVVHPLGAAHISAWTNDPWPIWIYTLAPGIRVRHERLVRHGEPTVLCTWTLLDPCPHAKLIVRPLLSGRDYHALHHANPAFNFQADEWGGRIQWDPYPGLPPIVAVTNGEYLHRPDWYRNFLYEAERQRGQDCTEDLASPGIFHWDLSSGEAALILSTNCDKEPHRWSPKAALALADKLRAAEHKRRATFASPLHLAADAYIVRRQPSPDHPPGATIIAGYPWFTDWGRDTFIALRGLCLTPGLERLDDARDILLTWASLVSEGMLPNRLPDKGDEPEFNAVDASLWFVIAAGEYLRAAKRKRHSKPEDRTRLIRAIDAIITGYSRGTRYNIALDADGLIRAGTEGVQLTWMDAKVGDWVVTPRIGKPVEIQALWLNALKAHAELTGQEHPALAPGLASFRARFWNPSKGYLNDVVDNRHNPGEIDDSLRPNQLYAVGGLPFTLLTDDLCRAVIDRCEQTLMTPMGPRSLAPGSHNYRPNYTGDLLSRDGAYHMGTVWPHLAGPFVEAWVRVRGWTDEAKREARARFLQPLLDHQRIAGVGHISEIADAEPPHTPRGCPFQAWAVGETLRLDRSVLAIEPAREPGTAHAPASTQAQKARRASD
jgi:predicted glycogen debranching enzyme